MSDDLAVVPYEAIEERIVIVRGRRVMLDRDLALLYGVETRALNQAVKRNRERFQKISCSNWIARRSEGYHNL